MNKILETLLEEKKIKLKGSLYHLTQINFSYNSNHIEGSQLTEEQTQYIYETNSFISDKEKVVSIDDINETVNHFKCFDYILENINILDENLIKSLHKILKNNTSDSQKEWSKVGDYKLKANFIEGMGCIGGCVGGPKRIVDPTIGKKHVDEVAYSSPIKVATHSHIMDEVLLRLGINSLNSFEDKEKISIFEREF